MLTKLRSHIGSAQFKLSPRGYWINSNGTGGGNWSAGASWSGGSAPTGAQPATIVAGDTITKDTTEGLPDCTDLIVNGILDIGTFGVKASGTFTGTGELKGTTGRLYTVGGYVFNTCTVKMTIVGTSGNRFEVKSDASIYINDPASGFHDVIYCDFNHGGTHRFYTTKKFARFESCTMLGVRLYGGGGGRFKNCTLGSGGNSILFEVGSMLRMDGGTLAGTLDFNALPAAGYRNFAELQNVDITAGTYISRSSSNAPIYVKSQSHDVGIGDWRHDYLGGYVMRSTASAKTGTYGIEFVPQSLCAVGTPVWIDIPIPVDSGDSIAPSLYFKNATADLNLEGTANLMVFELDPGNEWGLNQTIDASTLSDPYNNWVAVSFTGGTAGGTSKKGSLIVRATLKKYVSTGVVYVADLTY